MGVSPVQLCVCLYLYVCEDNLFEKWLFLPYNSLIVFLKEAYVFSLFDPSEDEFEDDVNRADYENVGVKKNVNG